MHHALELQALVARFANSLDLKDWDGLGACLADEIHTDYSDLRGTPPETVTRDVFVDFRRQGLKERSTHHLSGNVEAAVAGDTAKVTASMLVFVREPAGELLTIHCVYFLQTRRQADAWRIEGIRQQLLIRK